MAKNEDGTDSQILDFFQDASQKAKYYVIK